MNTARYLREKDSHVSIVFLNNDPSYVFDGYEVHAIRYWLKLLTLDKLKQLMDGFQITKPYSLWDYEKEHTLLYKDNGADVSALEGEAQKIAIARALYKKASFVVFDELTVLFPISEAEIYENFNLLVHDKTTLYISHRMSSCNFCDRIIVMEVGCILEEGTHEELLKQNH